MLAVEVGGSRFALMARIAVRGAPRDPGKGPIRYRWDLFKFELRLRWLGFVSWWQTVYVRLLTVHLAH